MLEGGLCDGLLFDINPWAAGMGLSKHFHGVEPDLDSGCECKHSLYGPAANGFGLLSQAAEWPEVNNNHIVGLREAMDSS
jgi:hypothetical protein